MTDPATGRKRPTWYFQVRDSVTGTRRTVPGTANRAETEAVERRVKLEARLIRKGLLPRPKPVAPLRLLAEVVTEFLTWGRAQGGHGGRPWSPVHARMVESHLRFWQEHLRVQYLHELVGIGPKVQRILLGLRDGSVATDCANGRAGPRAPATAQDYADALVRFCRWCCVPIRAYLEANPLAGLERFSVAALVPRRALTLDEIRRLLDACDPSRRLLYEVALLSGLRANEIRSILVVDLDVERRGFRLRAANTKNRKDGFQPVPAALFERLLQLASGRPAAATLLEVPTHTARMLDLDLAKAGIEKQTAEGKVDFHSLRHSFVTLLVTMVGADPKAAQTLARHATLNMTLGIYAHVTAPGLRSAVESAGGLVLGPPSGTPAALGAPTNGHAPGASS